MTNHPRRRRKQRVHPDDPRIGAAIALTSAVRGCTCQPDIYLRHTPNGPEARIEHDDWCPAANTGTAFAVLPPTHQRKR